MEANRALVYRCDVARGFSGWPAGVTLWGSVPPGGSARIAAQLIGLREVRMCISLTGRHNLVFTVWLRTLVDILPMPEGQGHEVRRTRWPSHRAPFLAREAAITHPPLHPGPGITAALTYRRHSKKPTKAVDDDEN
jgi:hypothetical protein